jgi:hypothetical protein
MGRAVFITKCSPGRLGPVTAKAIYLTDADIFITARDLAKGEQVAKEILEHGEPSKVEVIQMGLGYIETFEPQRTCCKPSHDL